ncbi:MAG TPA: hypothetical protein DFS52_27160 [Myxococcales bacterium]|jgi:pimeloyl-ACP methyl ester carboxylesterase|nr:hypothetical protein [Myxococcales bacterium]
MPRLCSTLFLACALLLTPTARAEGPWRVGKHLSGLRTRDDTRVALYRYVPDGGPRASRGRVLLFPDVGMTHRVYDVFGRGLAPFLMRRGFEVFVVEYRGAGASEVPLGGFDFEALVEGDAEAAFAQASSGHERIFLGGLGLGGTIAFMLAGRHPEQVSGVVGLQAAITLDVPNEPVAEALGRLEEAGPWIDLSALLQRPLFYGRSWFEVMLASDRSISAHELAELRRLTVSRVPRNLVAQLGGFMKAGAITVSGEDVRAIAGRYPGPSLLLFAPRDNWIHPEFSTPLRDVLPGRTHVRVLSLVEGALLDYGHLGMLFGRWSRLDVYDPVLRFLKAEARRQ